MKKLIIILLTVAAIIFSFFYYEDIAFNKFITNSTQEENMNIPINHNAPVKARNQIEIDAPVEAVWKTLTDISKWTSWQKDVTKTTVDGEIAQGTQFDWKAGGISFKSKIHTCNAHSDFGWTGTTIGASAIHNWFFEGKDNRTVVRVEESLQGVFPRLFKGYFQKNLEAGIIKSLQELKSASEANQ